MLPCTPQMIKRAVSSSTGMTRCRTAAKPAGVSHHDGFAVAEYDGEPVEKRSSGGGDDIGSVACAENPTNNEGGCAAGNKAWSARRPELFASSQGATAEEEGF